MSTRLTLDVAAGVARISLDAPERANAIDPGWAREFRDLTSGLCHRSDLRTVVLRSEGSAFCVGGDVRYFSSCADPHAALRELADDLHAGLLALSALDAPVLASVQGVAAGAGMSLVLAADLAIASRAASFTMAYTGVGLTPDGGSSYWLPRAVGYKRAIELTLTNRRLSALEAAELGLITEVVDAATLTGRTDELAAQLAAGPTSAYGEAKRLLMRSSVSSFRDQLEAEAESIARAAASPNGREGVTAFVEKRRPRFVGGDHSVGNSPR